MFVCLFVCLFFCCVFFNILQFQEPWLLDRWDSVFSVATHSSFIIIYKSLSAGWVLSRMFQTFCHWILHTEFKRRNPVYSIFNFYCKQLQNICTVNAPSSELSLTIRNWQIEAEVVHSQGCDAVNVSFPPDIETVWFIFTSLFVAHGKEFSAGKQQMLYILITLCVCFVFLCSCYLIVYLWWPISILETFKMGHFPLTLTKI